MTEERAPTLDDLKRTFREEPFRNPVIKDPEVFFQEWKEAKEGRRRKRLKKRFEELKTFSNQQLDCGAVLAPKQEK